MNGTTMIRPGCLGRSVVAAAVLFAALGVCATPFASAASRSYDSQMTGFSEPEAIAIDGEDNVWVSDLGNGVLSKYDPYPSNTKIDQQTGGGAVWGGGYQVHSIAASDANEFLYVGVDTEEGAACGGTPFAIFDNYGNLFKREQPDYETLGPACQMWFGVDNGPQTDSYGNYYFFTGQAPMGMGTPSISPAQPAISMAIRSSEIRNGPFRPKRQGPSRRHIRAWPSIRTTGTSGSQSTTTGTNLNLR
jgi:hypothetical protein